jgi:hypothetical protein
MLKPRALRVRALTNASVSNFALAVIYLSKVEHLLLDKLAAPGASILHHAPVAMLFAVFDSRVALQKHSGHRFYS